MTTALTATAAAHLTADQIDLVKRTICKGANDDELQMFLATALRCGLDPFARQIFAVFRNVKNVGKVMTIQVSIDGFRLIADRTGCYAPGKPTEYDFSGENPNEWVATVYVKKLVAGEWHELSESATFVEFKQTFADGNLLPLWKKMPKVMLAKCAEARALRRAFPANLGGVYIPEEIDGTIEIDAVEYSAPPKPEEDPLALEVAELKALIEADKVDDDVTVRLNKIPRGPERDMLKAVYDDAAERAAIRAEQAGE